MFPLAYTMIRGAARVTALFLAVGFIVRGWTAGWVAADYWPPGMGWHGASVWSCGRDRTGLEMGTFSRADVPLRVRGFCGSSSHQAVRCVGHRGYTQHPLPN
jgi:hypothetical protein